MSLVPRQLLLRLHAAAVESVGGRQAVARHLRKRARQGPVHLLALGKAAAAMTQGALDVLGDAVLAGLAITREGYTDPALDRRIVQLEAAHPVPDVRSLAAGRAVVDFLERAPDDAHFLVLISGGASSLVELPADGIGIDQLAALNRWLLGGGRDIHAMNRIRRACSRIKGGRLAYYLRGRPAEVLLISDVRGDDPASIGSGPLCPSNDVPVDASELPEPLRALVRHAPAVPPIEAFAAVRTTIVASNAQALNAAAALAEAEGRTVHRHAAFLDGDAVASGAAIAACLNSGPPGIHLWGGEPTVRLPERPGRGGRMQALALSAARTLNAGCYLLAGATDGVDGSGDDAGAVVDADTRKRSAEAGFEIEDGLAQADAGTLLAAAGDLFRTGPTGTNVMDVVIGLRQADD